MNHHDEQTPVVGNGLAMLRRDFGFNYWANQRILDQAAKLSDAELHAPDQTNHGSAFQMLLHALDTEWGWRLICQEGYATELLWEVEELPDLPAVVRFWQGEHASVLAYLEGLSDADLQREVDFGTMQGNKPTSTTVGNLLAHILYHSANHRSEVAVYLTRCGHSPGNIDFLNYILATPPSRDTHIS